MQRRDFMGRLVGMSLLAVLPSACRHISSHQSVSLISAAKDKQGFAVFGMNAAQRILWRFALPERAHAASISPHGVHVIITGRRPSTQSWLLETSTGKLIKHIKSQPHRHFFGHSVFDSAGRYLFSTENNTHNFAGLVVVRDLHQNAAVVNEFSSGGIGPHELLFMPESSSDASLSKRLVVANGGIKTAAGSRKKLNLETMQPNLAYLNAVSGKVIQRVHPAHHKMSIRHISVRQDGLVGVGVQFQGNKTDNIPLILTHHMGDTALTPMQMANDNWLVFNQYIGSVAINSQTNQLCATSPRGNCIALFDLTRMDKQASILPLLDGCGVAATTHGFSLSDGLGNTSVMTHHSTNRKLQKTQHTGISWDNHITAI